MGSILKEKKWKNCSGLAAISVFIKKVPEYYLNDEHSAFEGPERDHVFCRK